MNPKIAPFAWIYEKVQGMYTPLDDRPWPRFLFCDLLPLKKKNELYHTRRKFYPVIGSVSLIVEELPVLC